MDLAEEQKLIRHMHHVGERVFVKFESWPLQEKGEILPCNGPLTIIQNKLFLLKSDCKLFYMPMFPLI